VRERDGVVQPGEATLLRLFEEGRRALKGVLLGLLISIVVSCASHSHSLPGTAPASPTQHDVLPSDPKAQIRQLDDEILNSRRQMGLPEPVPCVGEACAHVAEALPALPSTDATCHHGSSEICTSACTLADSICTNAGKICDLAKQLPGDDWAAGKCASGETSCRDARERCCGCS
jgi:hypothetical protein